MGDICVRSTPRANRHHRCQECRREIKKSEIYVRYSGAFEGQGYAVKSCQKCESIRDRAISDSNCTEDEYPPFGDLRNWLAESDLTDLLAEFEIHAGFAK